MRVRYPAGMNERPRVLQVSELTREIQGVLQDRFRTVTVEGELSNFRPASSGHWYFALKDEESLIQCVMFRSATRGVSVQPQDGALLRVSGALTVYGPRGAYQIVVQAMEHAGSGGILALLEERKRRLAAEGLFERQRPELRRPLPVYPRTVAVVTSPTGAALRDILQILGRRAPGLAVRILPSAVQGTTAGAQLAGMIEYAGVHRLGEVIIVTRGGGSLEDLLPFSEEAVVRAIHGSPVPVISAVGHEIDWSLADFAADHRAPTPSAAAEIVCASRDELLRRMDTARQSIVQAQRSIAARLRSRLQSTSPEELLYRFRNHLQPWYQRLDDQRDALHRNMGEAIATLRIRFDRAADRIAASDPRVALRRGFALVRDSDSGEMITSGLTITSGQSLLLEFDDSTVPVVSTAGKETDNAGI